MPDPTYTEVGGVWVLVIDHPDGTSVWAANTEQAARKRLYAYVRDWWGPEVYEQTGEEYPGDSQDTVDRYFARVYESESYLIAHTEVLT